MSKTIPVKYNDEIVGYTTDEGKTIQFNDSDASKRVNEMLSQKQTVWVSSRAIGEIKSDNTVEEKEKISYDISHFENTTIKQLKVMNKEQAKDALIEVLMNQVMDLSMMSKIELGDDVIAEIKRLKEIINEIGRAHV